jgi:hypothetical protein
VTLPLLTTPNIEREIRPWAAAQPRLSYFGGRFYWAFAPEVTYPACRVYKSGGGRVRNGGDTPEWEINLAWDTWSDQEGEYQNLRDATDELEALIEYLTTGSGPQTIGTVVVLDSWVNASLPSPDPASGWPRFIVDSTFRCVPASAG